MTRKHAAKSAARTLAAATGAKYTEARRASRGDVEGALSEPVHCPGCGAGPGRQAPLYAGHGEGAPFATGSFRCEICECLYGPGKDGSPVIYRWEERVELSTPTVWADASGSFVLPDGTTGNPGCEDCGQADAVVRYDGRYLCDAGARTLGLVRSSAASYQATYAIRSLVANCVVKEGTTVVTAASDDEAINLATDWVRDNDPYCDDRIDPVVEIISVEPADEDSYVPPLYVTKLDASGRPICTLCSHRIKLYPAGERRQEWHHLGTSAGREEEGHWPTLIQVVPATAAELRAVRSGRLPGADLPISAAPAVVAEEPRRECPDGGACHHLCQESCFRVMACEPLSGVYPNGTWPDEVVRANAAPRSAGARGAGVSVTWLVEASSGAPLSQVRLLAEGEARAKARELGMRLVRLVTDADGSPLEERLVFDYGAGPHADELMTDDTGAWYCQECEQWVASAEAQSAAHADWCSLHPMNEAGL